MVAGDTGGSQGDSRLLSTEQVRALHGKSGHVGRERLVAMIRRARGDAAARAADTALQSMVCGVCERRRPRLHGAAVVERERQFNDRVLVDSVQLVRVRGKPFWAVSMVDCGTRYLAAALVPDRTAEAAARAFTNEWVLRLGPPRECGSDHGGEFIGSAFGAVCEEYGIRKFDFAAEHPDSHGLTHGLTD